MQPTAAFRRRLSKRLPLAYGVSGPLATPLFSSAEVACLIGVARDNGVSIFDTGPSYGAGEAESRLGVALRGDHDAMVMTKAGVEASGVLRRRRNFAPAAVLQSVERSLTRLGRERIDLLWLHGPSSEELNDDLSESLERLQREGKIFAAGLTAREPALIAGAVQPPFSAFMAPAHDGVLPPPKTDNGPLYFGIECLANVRRDRETQFGRSSLWRMLRSIIRNQQPAQSIMSAQEAFVHAFDVARCDVVVTTTTRASRLEENIRLCRAYRRRGGWQ